jgi:hypothetical protein
MVFGEFIEYLCQFILEPVPYINNFVLCWGIDIKNDDITPATS